MVTVAEATVRSVIVAVLIVVVANSEVPVTANEPVVVLLVTVRSVINAVSAVNMLAKMFCEKKLVDVPLTVARFCV